MSCCNKCNQTTCICRYNGPEVTELGITTGMPMDDAVNIIANYVTDIEFEDGVGIESVVDNGDGTFTFNMTNGSTFTTPNFTIQTGYTDFWNYDNTSTAPSPAASVLRVNSAIPVAITKLYVSATNFTGNTRFDFLDSFINNSPTPTGDRPKFGYIKLFSPTNINRFVILKVTSITGNPSDYEYDVEAVQIGASLQAGRVGLTFTPSESFTDSQIITFSGWDMDTNMTFNVAHTIPDYTKIISIRVMMDTSPTTVQPLDSHNGTTVDGGINQINTTDIVLYRLTGGIYDNPLFSNASGRIMVEYLK